MEAPQVSEEGESFCDTHSNLLMPVFVACCLKSKAIRNALAEIGMQVDAPTLCYQDNQPCIRVAEGGNFSSGGANSSAVRAMDIRCSKVQEMIMDDHELRLKWLQSCDMVADLDTKQVPRRQFEFLRDVMNGYGLVRERYPQYLKGRPDISSWRTAAERRKESRSGVSAGASSKGAGASRGAEKAKQKKSKKGASKGKGTMDRVLGCVNQESQNTPGAQRGKVFPGRHFPVGKVWVVSS